MSEYRVVTELPNGGVSLTQLLGDQTREDYKKMAKEMGRHCSGCC